MELSEDGVGGISSSLDVSMIAYLLAGFSTWLWYPLFGKYILKDLRLTGGELGLIMMIYNLSYAISVLPAGRLSDIMGRKKIMGMGLILMSISTLMMANFHDTLLLSMASLVSGIGYGSFITSITAHAVQRGGIRRTGVIYGAVLSAGLLGDVMGSFIGGLVKELFGSYMLFTLSSISSLLTLPSVRFIREKAGKPDGQIKLKELIFERKDFKLLSIGLIFHAIGFNMIFPFISVHAHNLGLTDYGIGLINSTWVLSMVFTTIFWGILIDKIGGKIILSSHLVASLLSWILYAYSWNFETIVISAVIMGFVSAMDMPARRKIIAAISGGRSVGTMIGSLDLITSLISIPSPMIGGILYGFLEIKGLFWLGSLINLIGVWFLLRVGGY